MKLAYPIGTPDTKGRMLAYTGNVSEMLADLKAIGYTGLEPFVRNPEDMNVSEFAGLVDKYGFEIAAVGTGPVVAEDKLTFTAKEESVRETAIQRAKNVVQFAARFGSQVNVGKLRGEIHPGLEVQSWLWMKEAFLQVCDYAARNNVKITLEPQNQFVINNLNSTQQALSFLKDVNTDNLFLMLDVFHMHMEDKSIAASMIEARDVTLHIHFADSNRFVPGKGGIHFAEVIGVMKALNYNRYITMEVNQTPNSRAAAEQAYNYVHALIKEV
ncbi:MAG: sugar phosphate isomerase/epimerase [Paenibacillus sp.]|jgi:sugar phosphate isomerase/epimerase|nr:sugar phosphate isomerase/epimerase [Paenibacillus sp.]